MYSCVYILELLKNTVRSKDQRRLIKNITKNCILKTKKEQYNLFVRDKQGTAAITKTINTNFENY